MQEPVKIFISRTLEENSPLHDLSKVPGITLTAESLIKIEKVPFSFTPPTKWIFFSSKNAIRYFFDQKPELAADTKFAVIGAASAEYLEQYQLKASFIGQGVDLKKIALDFREVLGNDSILFPQAMDSLQTIQKQLAFSNTTYNIYTYKTSLRNDFILPLSDILVFTSPSNARAYFSKYRATQAQRFVAMGASTRYTLFENGIRDIIMPKTFTETGLKEAILECCQPAFG